METAEMSWLLAVPLVELFDVKVGAILFETFDSCNIATESSLLSARTEMGTSNEMKRIFKPDALLPEAMALASVAMNA